jgi:hypothetical protein
VPICPVKDSTSEFTPEQTESTEEFKVPPSDGWAKIALEQIKIISAVIIDLNFIDYCLIIL